MPLVYGKAYAQPARTTKNEVSVQVTEDPWIAFFTDEAGNIQHYRGYAIIERDGRVWSRDLRPWLGNRSIGTSLTLQDAMRAIDIQEG